MKKISVGNGDQSHYGAEITWLQIMAYFTRRAFGLSEIVRFLTLFWHKSKHKQATPLDFFVRVRPYPEQRASETMRALINVEHSAL